MNDLEILEVTIMACVALTTIVEICSITHVTVSSICVWLVK